MKVVTWQDSRGNTIDICPACERKLAGNWPKSHTGEEYAQVAHGLHQGLCDICQPDEEATDTD